MIQVMRWISVPFIAVAVIAVLVIHGSDEAERTMNSYNAFFDGL